jgi:hypothetical protein
MKVAAAKTRHARLLSFKSAQITTLQQQFNRYRTGAKKQTQRIQELEDQICNIRASSATEEFDMATNTMFADLMRNKDQVPSARRYSLDTLTWARETMGQSPAVYLTVREILPLPPERCLQQKFMKFQLRVRQALTDIDDINLLIDIWREVNLILGSPILSRRSSQLMQSRSVQQSQSTKAEKWKALTESISLTPQTYSFNSS